MINVSKHAMERYLVRIKDVDKSEIVSLIAMYSERYKEELNKMYDHAKFIYQGKFNDKHKNTKFYVADDICLVISLDGSNIITLFEIDFGFNRVINKTIQEELMKELEIKDEELLEIMCQIEEKKNELENQLSQIDLEIESLEATLKALKDNRNGLKAYIDSYGSEEEAKKQERDLVAKKICYSNIYRNALEEYTK